jgi:hypothetical protein
MKAGRALGVPLATTALVQELFAALRVKGRGRLDHSSIIAFRLRPSSLPSHAGDRRVELLSFVISDPMLFDQIHGRVPSRKLPLLP